MVARSRSKALGTSAEREYLHKYFAIGWAGCRVAGSGSMPVELPDVIIGHSSVTPIAVEIKVERLKAHWFGEQEITDLKTFATKMNIEAMVAIKFMGRGRGWKEFPMSSLRKTKTGWVADEISGNECYPEKTSWEKKTTQEKTKN